MTKQDNVWQLVTMPFNPDLNEVLFQLYFGAQFIAMAGRHLIKQRNDDSNTSMVFDSERHFLIGEEIFHNIRPAFNLSDLSLTVLQGNSVISPPVSMAGFTLQNVFI